MADVLHDQRCPAYIVHVPELCECGAYDRAIADRRRRAEPTIRVAEVADGRRVRLPDG